jgi:hypothetical protein
MTLRLRKPVLPVLVVVALAGAAILGLGVSELVRDARLGASGARATARVTATATRHSRAGAEYLVRYELVVRGRTYRYTDATGRDDLWADVSGDEWDEARARRAIAVRYVDADPSTSAPASFEPRTGDHVAGLVLGGALVLFALLGPLVERRAAMRGRPSPIVGQRRSPGRYAFWERGG